MSPKEVENVQTESVREQPYETPEIVELGALTSLIKGVSGDRRDQYPMMGTFSG